VRALPTLTAGLVLLAGACATPAAPAERPAVIVQASAAGHAELLRTVREALGEASVTLADDALTHSSVLLIERSRQRDAAGQRLNGRELQMPDRFDLRTRHSQCLLVHERTQRRWTLRESRCAAR
jgi:hypothetical protein